MNPHQYAVVAGDPMDGLNIFGPFDDLDEAASWAETEIKGDWWTTRIYSPNLG